MNENYWKNIRSMLYAIIYLKITKIESKITNYKSFMDLIKKTARKCILRGCRTQYITGLDKSSAEQKKQTGFRPGKSCTSQILNLTQHMEDGYKTKKITGAVFVWTYRQRMTWSIKKLNFC